MELRTAVSPKDVKHYTTDRLREEFLIQNLFTPDEIKLIYSHIDRIITGAATPVNEVLKLTAGDELRAEYFLQRREMGVINIGGDGIITIDGREYSIKQESNKLVISSLVDGKPVGKKYSINIVNSNSTKNRPAVIADPRNSVISLLKDVPAEFIIKLIDKKIIIDSTENKPSAFLPSENKIKINSTSPASSFVILHEGVHSLDIDFIHNAIQYNLSKNTDLKKSIEKELRQAQATEPALIFNRDMNYYFKLNAANRRIGEIFADATALTYNLPDINSIALRVFELMRNFPTSIAKSLSNFNRVR